MMDNTKHGSGRRENYRASIYSSNSLSEQPGRYQNRQVWMGSLFIVLLLVSFVRSILDDRIRWRNISIIDLWIPACFHCDHWCCQFQKIITLSAVHCHKSGNSFFESIYQTRSTIKYLGNRLVIWQIWESTSILRNFNKFR